MLLNVGSGGGAAAAPTAGAGGATTEAPAEEAKKEEKEEGKRSLDTFGRLSRLTSFVLQKRRSRTRIWVWVSSIRGSGNAIVSQFGRREH